MGMNTWRNINIYEPIHSAQLGLFVPKYNANGYFPFSKHNMSNSRWYVYPKMTYNECLFFNQYDRKSSILSDIWHCALSDIIDNNNQNEKKPSSLRKSFDVKVFIILKE